MELYSRGGSDQVSTVYMHKEAQHLANNQPTKRKAYTEYMGWEQYQILLNMHFSEEQLL